MAKNKKLQNVAVLAIFLFVAIMAIAEFGGLFSIYHETTGTSLNVGDKVYFRPQVFDTGGFIQSGAAKTGAEATLYNQIAAGGYCYATQTLNNAVYGADTTRHLFKSTPTTSAGGKYYELSDGSLYFTSSTPATVTTTIKYYCGSNPTIPILTDTARTYSFVSSGGSTQTCNPTDCNAKSNNICEGEMLKQNVYGCIDGSSCVARSSSLTANTECKNKYWTSICSANGKTWDGSSCVAPKAETPTTTTPTPQEPTPTLPSQAEITCKLSSGTWDITTSTCLAAIDIADPTGADTGTNTGANTGDIGKNNGSDDFVSKYKYWIAFAIIGIFAWLAWLIPYMAKRK